jgi:glycosyltransferase involved in cell wall biosynthesis
MTGQTLRVLVATPLGRGGQGGIDRLMDALADELSTVERPAVDVRFIATRGKGALLLSPFVLMRFCLALIAGRVTGGVDVLHINLASSGSTYRKLIIAGLARLLGVPYVLHLHGGGYRDFLAQASPSLHRRITTMFQSAAGIVTLGRVWARFVIDTLAVDPDRVLVLPNAAPLPALPHEGGGSAPHILFLGKLGAEKGIPELIDALAALAAVPGARSFRATLAGDGDVAATRDAVSALGLANHVAVPGWIGPDEIAGLMARSDILVLPSHVENLPMSIIEAMAAGLAVVATPVGAVPDIVEHEVTGLLVPVGDATALAQALETLIAHPEECARLGAAGRVRHRSDLAIGPYADRLIALWSTAAHPSS